MFYRYKATKAYNLKAVERALDLGWGRILPAATLNLKGKVRKANDVSKLIYNIASGKEVVMENQVRLQLRTHKNADIYFVA